MDELLKALEASIVRRSVADDQPESSGSRLMQFANDNRRRLLGYEAVPTLDREAVARYTLGDQADTEELLAPFRAARLAGIWSELVTYARPALGIEVAKGPPAGRTKLGGLPHLPAGAGWPRRGGKPLAFVAQIDLEEASHYIRDKTIPSSGLLSFFYEADELTPGYSPADSGAWRVVLLDGPIAATSPPPASDAPDYDPQQWTFREAGVRFVPRISLPGPDNVLVEQLNLDQEDWSAYHALLDELSHAHGLSGVSQWLGYPAEIQGDPMRTGQLASHGFRTLEPDEWTSKEAKRLLAERAERQLLLQIDSISEIGMDWADSGVLYYSIDRNDLQAGKWDAAWLVMESL
jgi:hypothetical protein